MNILQIGTTDKRGGAALVSWKIKERLDSENIKNTMFVADKLSFDDNVFEMKRNKYRKYASIIFGKDLYNSDEILKTKQFQAANLVHFHNIHGRYFDLSTFEKICSKKPVVWTLHDEWAITEHSVYTFETAKIANGFFKSPNNKMPERVLFYNKHRIAKSKKKTLLNPEFSIVTPSLWLQERVARSYLKDKTNYLIHNGVDNNKFRKVDKAAARKKLGLPQDKKIIFSLSDGGANSPTWKGWQYSKKIIKHFNNDKNIIFLSAGNKNTASKRNANVIYTGLVDNDQLFYYFSACDILLNTSIADNFPLIILEAMSCGLPIISFDVGGVKEAALDGENGFISRYKNTDDIIVKIKQMMQLEPANYNLMSKNCVQRINEKFTIQKMTDNYISLYKSLIN